MQGGKSISPCISWPPVPIVIPCPATTRARTPLGECGGDRPRRRRAPSRGGHPSVGGPPRARCVPGGHVPRRHAAVPRAADGGQDAAPPPRRLGRGVEHRHGLLPGRAAGRVRIRPPHARPAGTSPPIGPRGDRSRRAAAGAAHRGAEGLAAARRRHRRPVDARGARRDGRPAVLLPLDGEPDAAAVVQRHRPPARRRSLLPLRRRQRRQPPGAARLPLPPRARARPRRPGSSVDRRLRHLRRARGRLRPPAAPPCRRPSRTRSRPLGRRGSAHGSVRRRRTRRGPHGADLSPVGVVDPAPLDRLRRRPVGADARGHAPPVVRRRLDAAAVGRAPVAVPRDLHHRLRAAAGRAGAGVRGCSSCSPCPWC